MHKLLLGIFKKEKYWIVALKCKPFVFQQILYSCPLLRVFSQHLFEEFDEQKVLKHRIVNLILLDGFEQVNHALFRLKWMYTRRDLIKCDPTRPNISLFCMDYLWSLLQLFRCKIAVGPRCMTHNVIISFKAF